MRVPIVGGPRDGDTEVIGDRSEDRDPGKMHVFDSQAYVIEALIGKGPRLKWLSPWRGQK